MIRRTGALAWLALIVVLCGLLAFQIHQGLDFDTDLLSLLPEGTDDPLLELTSEFLGGPTSRNVQLAIRRVPSTERDRIRNLLQRTFEASSVVSSFRIAGSGRMQEAFFDYYFPYRYQFLAPSLRRILDSNNPVRKVVRRIRNHLYSPRSTLSPGLLERDPLLLFPALADHWRHNTGQLRTGKTSGGNPLIAVLQLADDPYRPEVQDNLIDLLGFLRDRLRESAPESRLSWTGVVRFARSMRRRMRHDLWWIGLLSTAAIVLLIRLAFRSFRYLLVLALAVGVGLLAALTLTVAVWEIPHLFTVVFSTSLLGVSVDYAFHYFSEHATTRRSRGSPSPLRTILPGITLGMTTTVLGYLGLFLTPLPVLQQMAFFSAVGILGAYGTVVLLFPVLLSEPPSGNGGLSPGMTAAAQRLLAGWRKTLERPTLLVPLGIGIVLLVAGGLGRLNVRDDVRSFQEIPSQLIQRDRRLRAMTGRWNTGRFVVVRGESPQTVLRRIERINDPLRTLQQNNIIGDYRSLSPFLPSKHRQRSDRRQLTETLTDHRDRLRTQLDEVGLKRNSVDTLFESLSHNIERFITPQTWLAHPVSFGLRSLWIGRVGDRHGSLIMLRDIKREEVLQESFRHYRGSDYVNRVRTINRLLGQYRREATGLILAAYVAIVLILALRYGPRKGVLAAAPSVAGGILTLATLGLFGVTVNLTHVLALLLVLGIGIDYSVFLMEAFRGPHDPQTTMTAIVVSGLTTLASFGFLCISQATMISTIGLTVLIGIVFMLLLCPLVQVTRSTVGSP